MKVKELTAEFIADYIKADKDEPSEITLVNVLIDSAISYFCGQTGLERYELDVYEDITLAIMVLVQHAYDNRSMYVDSNNVNPMVQGIIDMHSGGNLL